MSKNVWGNTAALEAYLSEVLGAITEGAITEKKKYKRRHVWNIGDLGKTCDYIKAELETTGFIVEKMCFEAKFWKNDNKDKQTEAVHNLIAEIEGRSRPKEIVIVGAHYDSRIGMRGEPEKKQQRGKRPDFHKDPGALYYDTPGANDNGSGVAALLALAKAYCGQHLDRTLRFVAWVNEEYPFFSNYWVEERERDGETFYADGMGSYMHAKRCRDLGENIIGVISLDSLGIYGESGGLNLDACRPLEKVAARMIFPNRRNYVAFLSNYPSSSLVNRFWKAYCEAYRRSFGGSLSEDPEARAIVRPLEGHHLLPSYILNSILTLLKTGWSDDWAYWQFDYPGFVVTDTAYYRSASYHSRHDTPEVINFSEFTKVVWTLREAIENLVGFAS